MKNHSLASQVQFSILILGLLAAAAGCIPSLNPLYTEKELTYDPALVGVWSEQSDSKDTWTFAQGEAKSYNVRITDGDKHSLLVGHLVQLGDQKFLDLTPHKDGLEDTKREGVFLASLIPGHLVLWVKSMQPALTLSVMDLDWFGEYLKKNPKAIPHQFLDDRLIFTGSTRELQEFVLKAVLEPKAWSEGTKFSRTEKAQK